MTNFYADFVNGNDANNGLGPDASHASNKPFKTLTFALGATGIASGDTLYLSPAGPFRETCQVAMASAVAETLVIGDYANAQGFKTSGAVAVAPGPVIWTAYTTNDKTAPSGTSLFVPNSRDFLTFRNIMFVAGTASPSLIQANSVTSTNITFTDCAFLQTPTSNVNPISVAMATGVAANWLFDRCHFLLRSPPLFTLPTIAGADYDANIVFRNCVIQSSQGAISVTASGALANKGGGVVIRNCLIMSASGGFATLSANNSTTIPCSIVNSVVMSATTCLSAQTLGQITENYNLLLMGTRTNVTAGANSINDNSYAGLIHFGQERIWGGLIRQFGEPMAGSPLLGFGNDGSQTATDLRGTGRIRPAGLGAAGSQLAAAGALERDNSFVTDASPIGSGGSAIKNTGPGYAEFVVPVPARAITISCKVKWDATYAGTKPQLQIDANGRNGVSAETITATVAATNIETLTLTPFTPSKAGDYVRVRVISNDTNGAGVLQVDDFSVTG